MNDPTPEPKNDPNPERPQDERPRKPNPTNWLGFVTVVSGIAVIALCSYYLKTQTDSFPLWLAVSILQSVVSALLGYYIFPNLFGNKKLEDYHKKVAKSAFSIITAHSHDAAKDRILTGMLDQLTEIPKHSLERIIYEQTEIRDLLEKGGMGAGGRRDLLRKVNDIFGQVLNIETPASPPVRENLESKGLHDQT